MSFTNPEILYALPAVLIPLIIHLFNFRRYKKQYFSNVALLKEISIETKKHSRVKHLIVMILRMLAVASLIFAFAGPQFGKNNNENKNTKIITGIYIDNSFSMESGDINGRVFDKAISIARKLVKESAKEAIFVLQNNNNDLLRFLNKDEALSFIDNTKINSNPGNINLAMEQFIRFAAQKKDYSLNTYIFSDFQKSAFDPSSLPSDTISKWNFVELFNQKTANVYMDSCYLDSPVLLPGRIEKLYVKVKNASDNKIENLGLKLIIDDETKSIANIDISENGETTAEMQFNTGKKAWKKANVEIEDYPVTFDDNLMFSFEVNAKINVLAINKEDPERVLKAFYSSDSIFNLQQTSYKSIDYQNLNKNDLIILNGVSNISSGLITNLKDYVKEGGNLMLIPPSDNNISKFNELISGLKMGQIFGPMESETRVKGIKLDNSIFGEAIDDLPANADLPVIFKQFQYSSGFKNNTETLLSLLNGDPLLIKKEIGSGISYLLNISLDESFSNFSRHQLFVPMMYGSAIAGKSNKTLYNTIGESNRVEVKLNDNISELNPDNVFSIQKLNADFNFIPSQRVTANKLILNFDKLPYESGFYALLINSVEEESFINPILAFNYNRIESVMDFYTKSSIKDILEKSNISGYNVLEFQNSSSEEVINSSENESNQWLVFIIFALLFLLLEVLILRFWP